MLKKMFIAFAAAGSLAAAAVAADFAPLPTNYEDSAAAYISDRLDDPRAARFQFIGSPYQVYADIAGYEGLECWAVDVRVKSRLPSGGFGYSPFTVLFLDGAPVALEDDVQRFVKA